MVFQKPYQTQDVPTISYDFTDMLVGTAYKTFYIGEASSEFMISATPGSDAEHIVSLGTGTYGDSMTKVLDKDYTTVFNIPQIMEGKAAFSFSHGIGVPAGTDDPQGGWVKTEIALEKNGVHILSGQTPIRNVGATIDGPESTVDGISLTMPRTTFAPGDTFKINVKGYAKQGNGLVGRKVYYGIGTDPKGRLDAYNATIQPIEDTDSTIFEAHLPFNTKQ